MSYIRKRSPENGTRRTNNASPSKKSRRTGNRSMNRTINRNRERLYEGFKKHKKHKQELEKILPEIKKRILKIQEKMGEQLKIKIQALKNRPRNRNVIETYYMRDYERRLEILKELSEDEKSLEEELESVNESLRQMEMEYKFK